MGLRRVAMAVATIALGCGASPRMLHQSEAYYEHCHAADLDPRRSTRERTACWSAWLEHYAEGMPVGRVSHARDRLAGLRDGTVTEPLPGVSPSYTATFMALHSETTEDADTGASEASEASEAPVERARGDLRPPPPRPLSPRSASRTNPCNRVCEPRWEACAARAIDHGRDGIEACRLEHRVCLRACL